MLDGINNMNFQEWCISQKELVKKQYKMIMGKPLNLENPTTFSEKIQWLKVYDSTFLKTYCADKLLVREYVKEKIGKDLCLPVLGVYNKFEEIDFSKLPKNYVIKCNHGSGMNIIVKDGKVNKQEVKQKLEKWMNTDYLHLLEFHYKPIHKKIFIEQYMNNEGKTSLTDYKFSCFNGEPKFCQIINDRYTNNLHFNYYDLYFNPMKDVVRLDHQANYDIKDEKPKNWDLMIEYSKKLSEEFKYVRVDFYEIDGVIYFGELTFTPNSGYLKYKNRETDEKIGKLLSLK